MTTSTNSTSQSGGIGFVGLLTILFIGLKLTGYIDRTWLWVLSPIWISAAVAVPIIAVCILIAIFAERRR
jgi:hypothetical protein